MIAPMATRKATRSTKTGPLAFVNWLSVHVAPGGVVSDAELARKIGISQSMLVRYRTDLTMPSFEVIRRACDALGLPILTGLVMSGMISEEEAELKVYEPDVRSASNLAMLNELGRRLDLLPTAV